jgi:hypothetical protein
MRQTLVNYSAALLLAMIALVGQGRSQETRATSTPEPRITIAKQTTVLTAPLRPDGYVDYIAALNQQASDGVTPENNAALLFLQAWGPNCLEDVDHAHFFELLGIEPLPENGKHFIPFKDHAQKLARKQEDETLNGTAAQESYEEKLNAQFRRAVEHPWSKKDYPEIARWLRQNREPLDLIRRGSQRPRYFVPLLPAARDADAATLLEVRLTTLQPLRAAVRALSAHAMLRLEQRELEEAWSDLHACHRISRLVGQSPTLIDMLVSVGVEHVAFNANIHLIASENLSGSLARSIVKALQDLDPLPDHIKRMDEAERFMALDCIAAIAGGRTDIGQIVGNEPVPPVVNKLGNAVIEWDLILQDTNGWFDRIVTALNEPNYVKRETELDRIWEDLSALGKKLDSVGGWLGTLLGGRAAVSRLYGDILICLLLPSGSQTHEASHRAVTLSRLSLIGFALAAHRAERGNYPTRLADLVPDYLPAIPADPFTDKPFRYASQNSGFLLYSLGPNQKDDDGKLWYLDSDGPTTYKQEEADDYRLQVPPKRI